MQIQYINEEWKKQRSITDDMCNYSIHISKPSDKIGFYRVYPTVSPTVFIGMTLEEANNAENGWFVNPTIIDGVSVPVSASLCYNRVCVEVANNKIIGIESYGR